MRRPVSGGVAGSKAEKLSWRRKGQPGWLAFDDRLGTLPGSRWFTPVKGVERIAALNRRMENSKDA
jgi:hypothetical protein